jgi:hypothetical protein
LRRRRRAASIRRPIAQFMKPKVYLRSLGCPKNLVDSEVMLGLAARDGAEIVLDPVAADVVVVNTCGFIGDAKHESTAYPSCSRGPTDPRMPRGTPGRPTCCPTRQCRG